MHTPDTSGLGLGLVLSLVLGLILGLFLGLVLDLFLCLALSLALGVSLGVVRASMKNVFLNKEPSMECRSCTCGSQPQILGEYV